MGVVPTVPDLKSAYHRPEDRCKREMALSLLGVLFEHGAKTSLLEMVVRGQGLRDPVVFHDRQ